MKRELGDFQTPRELAAAIVRGLGSIGTRWTRVLEPTCGTGTFLSVLLDAAHPPREMIGIELQERHYAAASSLAPGKNGTRVELIRASLFELDLRTGLPWRESGPLLVVGNPPWVTAAALGKLGSGNLPDKSNIKNLKG
ncbi:MAG: class I SAM-dependent methyltransferase, partial [Isosphaeraceae bacterium]